MFSHRLTVGALALACVAAAGAGGYLASRQNAVAPPVEAAAAAANDTAVQPVLETEAALDAPAPPAAAPAPERPASRDPLAGTDAPRAEERRSSPPVPPRAAERTRSNAPGPRAERTPPATAVQPPVAASPVISAAPDPGIAPESARRPAEPLAQEPPEKVYQELVVTANSVIGLQIEERVSSETARVEDRVEARVSRDVRVGDLIAVPAGARAVGSVVQVERGGKFKERARLGIRFTTLVLADGTRLPMSTETIYREGDAPGSASAAKIGGGAVGGAILGAILGGAKGAAIGATAGAGGGVAAVQVGDASEVSLATGAPLTVRLLSPLTVTVEQ